MPKDEKKFINEKIVGRSISFKHAAKRIIVALLCGLVFGASAAFAFLAILKSRSDILDQTQSSVIGSMEDKSQSGEGLQDEKTPEDSSDADQDLGQAEGSTQSADASEGQQSELAAGITEDSLSLEMDRILKEKLEAGEYITVDADSIEDMTEEILELSDWAVVEVHAHSTNTTWFEDTVESSSLYAGLIIDESPAELFVLTSGSIAEGTTSLSVVFSDGTERDASMIQASKLDNISIISVSKEGLSEKFLLQHKNIEMGNSGALKMGDVIYAIGAPFGMAGSYDEGRIGGISRSEGITDGIQDVFYSSVRSDAVHGTFFVNSKLQLVGIASAEKSTEYMTAIVSMSYYRHVIDELRDGRSLPYIGIEGVSISDAMKAEGMPGGMYVSQVLTDSPAFQSGIKNGDIITRVGNATVLDAKTYSDALKLLAAGETVSISVMRSTANPEYAQLDFEVMVGSR